MCILSHFRIARMQDIFHYGRHEAKSSSNEGRQKRGDLQIPWPIYFETRQTLTQSYGCVQVSEDIFQFTQNMAGFVHSQNV